MKRIILLIGILSGIVNLGHAQDDHLVPATMDYYKENYPELFRKEKGEEFRFLKLPSWDDILGIILVNKQGDKILVKLKKEERKPTLLSEKLTISDTLYSTLKSLLLTAMNGIDFPENEGMGLDGITYYYSMSEGDGNLLEGQIWTPEFGSLMERLGGMCERMCTFSGKKKVENQLLQEMVSLQENMQEYQDQWKSHHKVYKSIGLWNLELPVYGSQVDELPYMRETMPTDYALKHLIYPENLLEKNVWGFIVCIADINEDGEIVSVNAIPSITSFDYTEFKDEAIRITSQMPAWVPARKNGKAVGCKYLFAIPFNPVAYKKKKLDHD